MPCPSCGKPDAPRSRRSGIVDSVLSWFGFYPYRCRACSKRFYARSRENKTYRMPAQEIPTAQITIRAESNEQLTAILLALDRAVASERATQEAPVFSRNR